MIVLLVCSINLSASNNNQYFYGRYIVEDSVLLSYEDIRNANAKLVELNYEKEINACLREVVKNDTIIIKSLKVDNLKLAKTNNVLKKQRNVGFISTTVFVLTTLVLLIK